MGQYEVVAPCAYTANGKGTIHRKLGTIIELDDDVAATLPGALRAIRTEAVVEAATVDVPKPKPKPKTTTKQGSDGADQ